MPAALTLTFSLVQSIRTVGWSETVVLGLNDVNNSTVNNNAVSAYTVARTSMLGAGVALTYAKLTLLAVGRPPVVSTRRQELLITPPQPFRGLTGQLPVYNPFLSANPADFSQTVLMVRFSTNPSSFPQYFRTFWVAGLPDVNDQTNFLSPVTGVWVRFYQNWRLVMVNLAQPPQILMAANDVSNANPAFLCTMYDPVTGKLTCPGHTILSGQQVDAIGWRANAGGTVPKGKYKALVNDDATITLEGAKTFVGIKSKGSIRPVSWVYPALYDYEERGFTNKKKGRPFGELRGRRSVSRTVRA